MGAQTVVADVADELARRVVTGMYEPGDLLPSVRQVAEEFEMNRATAQLVLGRLESYGFVDAHRGRGFTVRDVRRDGGVDVYRRLFRLSPPDIAVAMFRDVVETERAIVLDALLAYTESEQRIAPARLAAQVDELETLARGAEPDRHDLFGIEVELVRALLGELGHTMQRAVLNSLAELLSGVPAAVEAYFAVTGSARAGVAGAAGGVGIRGRSVRGAAGIVRGSVRHVPRESGGAVRGTGARRSRSGGPEIRDRVTDSAVPRHPRS
ncbi:winged helix-turn-helix domain-containing protein [Nocardia crassostreae]|uniref:winged helix-turn-helix domain-containing protein n=1 Tax=Nocardia crassostreae TaxID=53428 RepID=UPI000AE8E9A4|nr:GntR family transcriptional regulator [Nocardia crassostreae]